MYKEKEAIAAVAAASTSIALPPGFGSLQPMLLQHQLLIAVACSMNIHIPSLEEVVAPQVQQSIAPGSVWGEIMIDEEEHVKCEAAEHEAA